MSNVVIHSPTPVTTTFHNFFPSTGFLYVGCRSWNIITLEHYYFFNENEKRQVCDLHHISFYWVNIAGEFPRRAEMVTSSSTLLFQLQNDGTASSRPWEFVLPHQTHQVQTTKFAIPKKGPLVAGVKVFFLW